METISNVQIYHILKNIIQTVRDNQVQLNDLDSFCGDGDHGTSLLRGFLIIEEELQNINPQNVNINSLLELVGTTLISNVGSSIGPLYGTAFLEAARVVGDVQLIDLKLLCKMMEAALIGIEEMGEAQPGEKTMIDTLYPAVEAIKKAVENKLNLYEALSNVISEAKVGMESTKKMVAKKGRASRLGERTIGYKDPGAMSTYLFLLTAYKTIVCD